MSKYLIVVQAGPQDMAKALHGLLYAQELHEVGIEVQLIFDGAGTTWIKEFEKEDSRYNPLYRAVKGLDIITGACQYCAGAFGVAEEVKESGISLKGEINGHPSLAQFIKNGFIPLIL